MAARASWDGDCADFEISQDISRTASADSSTSTSMAAPGASSSAAASLPGSSGCDGASASGGNCDAVASLTGASSGRAVCGSAADAASLAAPASAGSATWACQLDPHGTPWEHLAPHEHSSAPRSARDFRGTPAFETAQQEAMEAAAAHELALAGQAAQAGASACANGYYVEGLGGESEVAAAAAGAAVDVALVLRPATTLIISGLPAGSTSRSVQRTLEDRGLAGTFDLLYWPAADAAYQGFLEGAWPDAERLAVVNFTAPSFAALCSWLFQDPSEGVVSLAPIQGLEENISYCGRLAGPSPPPGFAPTLISSATPCLWAVQAAEALMLDPEGSTIGGMAGEFAEAPKELKGQFRKTKLCVFASKRRACNLGDYCPYAHSQEELQPLPDLAKTRLCTAFLRGRCKNRKCRYAHGRRELRATDYFYKTDLCHWWAAGSCRLGASCRYAHGEDELRGAGGVPLPDSQGDCWSDASLAFEWSPPPASAFATEGEEQQQQQAPAATHGQGRAGVGEGGAEKASEPPAWRVHAISDDVADCAPKLQPSATGIYSTAGAGVAAVAPGRLLARSNRTFMEAVPIDNEALAMELPKRSFSCGDLDELARALEELESDELDVEAG